MTNPKAVKIVCIGIGSASFGRTILTDLLGSPSMAGLQPHLVLVDIDAHNLDVMARLAERLKAYFGSPATIEATTDRTAALPGADFLVISVARHRMDLWELDFRVPFSLGFKHINGENGGPGAAFHTLRSYELVLPICHDAERLCPNAFVLNFTNPESRVMMAIDHLTQLWGVGLCHGQFGARDLVAKVLCRPPEELDIVGAGLNHLFWMLRVCDRQTGEDLLPELRRRFAADSSLLQPLAREWMRIYGLLTYTDDSHPGEYVSYAHELYGTYWHSGRESAPVRLDPAASQPRGFRTRGIETLVPYADGQLPIGDIARLSRELAVPIISGMALNRPTWVPAVNVPNTDGAIGNLDREAIVEVPADVDGEGIHPVAVGDLPEGLAGICRTQISIQKLLVEAYRQRSRNLLLQALLLDPCVDSLRRAEKLIAEMYRLQGDFLPELT